MDIKTVDRILNRIRNHPVKTVMLIVTLCFVAIIGYFASGFFSELGRQRASEVKSNTTSIRISYFNIGGHAIDFLIKGKIDKNWEERLSGQPYIVPNSVFEELSFLLNNFSDLDYDRSTIKKCVNR